MEESRTADAPPINQATVSRIPVRSLSLAILVAVVLYVGMLLLLFVSVALMALVAAKDPALHDKVSCYDGHCLSVHAPWECQS